MNTLYENEEINPLSFDENTLPPIPAPFDVYTEGGHYRVHIKTELPGGVVFNLIVAHEDFYNAVTERIMQSKRKRSYENDVLVVTDNLELHLSTITAYRLTIEYTPAAESTTDLSSSAKNVILQFTDFISQLEQDAMN